MAPWAACRLFPAARGFDEYLGIPYSDDMGKALASACAPNGMKGRTEESGAHGDESRHERREDLYDDDDGEEEEEDDDDDKEDDVLEPKDPLDSLRPATPFERTNVSKATRQATFFRSSTIGESTGLTATAAVAQGPASRSAVQGTTRAEQPGLTRLDAKYKSFATDFIARHAQHPFFLYLPFSHVHTTAGPARRAVLRLLVQERHAARCLGDALAETDAIEAQSPRLVTTASSATL